MKTFTFKNSSFSWKLSLGLNLLATFDEFHYEKIRDGKNSIQIEAKNNGIRDVIYIHTLNNAFTIRRTITNNSSNVLRLKEVTAKITGLSFGGESKNDYFYHAENSRIYETMTFPIDYKRTQNDALNSEFDIVANNRWADPGVVQDRIGASPYQPFPAILLGNYKTKKGIVCGSLSQNVFYHSYLVGHDSDGVTLEVFSSFKGMSYRELKCGETLVDEWYLGPTSDADDIEKIFAEYTEVLRSKLPVGYGQSEINRNCLVWGSWNDGFFRDISHKTLIKEASAIAEYFPTVRWIQIDDGYAKYNKTAHGLGVPYEGKDGIDSDKFPKGLRSFADDIRACGLRPAIWIGGACPIKTKIYQEHPEWFLDYSQRMKTFMPLDVSKPEVRNYMKTALDRLIVEYGFDGVKHDFWSYAFEDSNDLYSNKTQSGYEMRSWWLKELRKRLPKDGYLQTGCDIVQGNPFLGEYFTNYRYGVDVAEASWDNIKTNMLWGAACFSTHTGDMIVPNSDAIGLFYGLSDNEFLFLTTYILVTRSCVELAGKYSEEKPQNWRLKVLQKAACCLNNGENVYFINYDYRKSGRNIPLAYYLKSAYFSREQNSMLPRRTLAVFNPDDEEKEISVDTRKMQISTNKLLLREVWTGEEVCVEKSIVSFQLPARSCKLFTVSTSETVILDSNVEIKNLKKEKEGLAFEIPYKSEVELIVNRSISRVYCNNESLDFIQDEKSLKFKINQGSNIEIS